MDLDMFMNASDSDILNETYVYIYVFVLYHVWTYCAFNYDGCPVDSGRRTSMRSLQGATGFEMAKSSGKGCFPVRQ